VPILAGNGWSGAFVAAFRVALTGWVEPHAGGTWIGQITFARGLILDQKSVMHRWAILLVLLSVGAGALLARVLRVTLYASVAPLALSSDPRRPPGPRALAPLQREPFAQRRGAVGVNLPPALSPSPYELTPGEELAPNPYGAIAPLAPDPYVDEHAVDRARPWTSIAPELSAPRRSALGASARLALAPSPYLVAAPTHLAPNPY